MGGWPFLPQWMQNDPAMLREGEVRRKGFVRHNESFPKARVTIAFGVIGRMRGASGQRFFYYRIGGKIYE